MNRILVPLDTSEIATAALAPAKEFAEKFGAEMMLATVVDIAVRNALQEAAASERAMITTTAETYLGSLAQELRASGAKVDTRVVESDDAAAAITDLANATGSDMIVVTTHGRSGAARWLLGSVTDRVIRSASVPVHVIPVRH